MTKIKLYVSTNLVGSRIQEIVDISEFGMSEEDWQDYNKDLKQDFLNEWATDFLYDNVEFGATEIE